LETWSGLAKGEKEGKVVATRPLENRDGGGRGGRGKFCGELQIKIENLIFLFILWNLRVY